MNHSPPTLIEDPSINSVRWPLPLHLTVELMQLRRKYTEEKKESCFSLYQDYIGTSIYRLSKVVSYGGCGEVTRLLSYNCMRGS